MLNQFSKVLQLAHLVVHRYAKMLTSFTFSFMCSLPLFLHSVAPHAQDLSVDQPADVRLLIDVSGSMKQNDPANLRQPAVDLLVKMLPDGSKAGVWTFGQYVNMLIPHKNVDEKWKAGASKNAAKINSAGLYTNIGQVLEKAAYDAQKTSSEYATSIILLTDGMVDIDKDPDVNQQEWRRIIDEVLPKIKDAGFTIHTIALSENADTDLLNQLSMETDGFSAVAKNADELMQAFLQAFNKAAPATELPFNGESFLVDSTVEEFTALIFHEAQNKPTALVAPDASRYTDKGHDDSVSWFGGDGYDLITVKRPFEGEWGVDAKVAANSRITVVSDLSVKIRPLPNNVEPGQSIQLDVMLRENGKTITNGDFLSLLDIDAKLIFDGDVNGAELYKLSDPNNIPMDGIFRQPIDSFDQQGEYLLSVVIDGKSFKRSIHHRFNIQSVFQASLKPMIDDSGQESFFLKVTGANINEINLEKTTATVTVTEPDTTVRELQMDLGDRNSWGVFYLANRDGLFQFEIVISGEYNNGSHLRHNLKPLSLVVDGDNATISDKVADQKSIPEKDITPDVPIDANTEDMEEQEITVEVKSEHNWLLYGLLAVGNFLLFGLLYFGYRIWIMEKVPVEDEDEDDFIDVNAIGEMDDNGEELVETEDAEEQDAGAAEVETEAAELEAPAEKEEELESMPDPDDEEVDEVLGMDEMDSMDDLVEAETGTATEAVAESETSNNADAVDLSADNEPQSIDEPSQAETPEPLDDIDAILAAADSAVSNETEVEASADIETAKSDEDESIDDLINDVIEDQASEQPELAEAVSVDEGSEPDAQEDAQAEVPAEPKSLESELDALMDEGPEPVVDADDWAAEIENSLNEEQANNAPEAEEQKVPDVDPLSAGIDLADDSVGELDLNDLVAASDNQKKTE